ncbi:hypothetical protein [Nocardia flavorosea]|uniref:hypothetical protein n=1 Tax=Nocardia flavorosea TaxID=53429 RepID=UPI002B4AB743|nr:hypothetical protein [Nocardia flavorosea]
MTKSEEVPGTAVAGDDSPGAPGGPAQPGTAAPDPATETDPDVGFTLTPAVSEQDVAEQARALMHQVARELGAVAPEGWQRVDAVFASTVVADIGFAIFSDAQQRAVRWTPTPQVLALVREHRQLSARLGDGPWWRLLLTLTSSGQIEVDHDYGDQPFPDDQLFAPEIYRADLEAFPRATLPVWLAAYLFHGDRQQRSPSVAAVRAAADRSAGVSGDPVAGLPPFPVMAARWAALCAAFVAVRSEWGPRLTPGLRWFEGASRSGSTLHSLPGGRAVLSGGVWNAPELDAAYNGEASLPAVFRGAPEWVAGPVLNDRSATGQLTFCYWWDGSRWYRGESPAPEAVAAAVPGVWDAATVVRIVTGLVLDTDPSDERRAAIETFVAAAESGTVTRAMLTDVFPEADGFDIDSAFYQLVLGGVTAAEPLPEQQAIDRVRSYLTDSGADTSGYPVADLRADRVDGGWMVFAPVAPGEIATGRAIFYLADDGVLERSSSSVAPSQYLPEFRRRFRDRNRTLI